MKTLFLSLLGAAIILTAQSADAQLRRDNWPNWYLGVHGELGFVSDADATLSGTAAGDVEFGSSYGIGVNLGYRPYFSNSFLDNVRFETEYFYRDANFDDLTSPGGVTTNLLGDLTGNSLMFNAYYDVDTGGSITPYIGGGLGFTWWTFDSATLNVSEDDSDAVFSYQGMAGIYFSPKAMPQTDWGVGYRYFGTGDPEFTTNTAATLEHDYSSHNLEFFGRFRF